ncbi:XF1762 family protein [Nocardiopsis sp. FR4]|uniref:XF1762 family protein n=1 Tax=Nocardiopsis sp. FR4 TaxID=2605985 RepID=UPI001358123E|nr:XF1762 family protein [Nocardiopsis sp. FR4]
MGLTLVPVPLAEAKAFIEVWHRHLKPPRGHKFSLGLIGDEGVLVAVAVVGRPVARGLDDGRTLEVTRLASDGSRNTCSMLYAASWRAARALAYRRLVTYTRADESGASLRAAGWRPVAELPAREDGHPPRRTRAEGVSRTRWEAS